MSWLSRLASQAPVPVFPCIGPGMLGAVERLFADRGLRRVGTPRAAAVLLVAGAIPDRAAEALDRVHDQIPAPRASCAWDGSGDAAADIRRLWAGLVEGRGGEPDRRPDSPPNPWRGEGDHGQGGEGMMGGVPYGRPMAMTADDPRDGLALDAYTARIGPFAPMLPPGLVLEVTLQGDVIAAAQVKAPPFAQPADASAPGPCAARLLRLLGLPLAARRVAEGRAPRALATRRAVPPGLGATQTHGDVRARLSDWSAGRAGPDRAPPISELLPGFEWHEAMLVLNSFSPDALRRASAPEAAA